MRLRFRSVRTAAGAAGTAALLAAAALPLGAQGASPSSATGLRKELIAQLEDAERKLVALAEATPQDKYGWRPSPGVRSVSEVFVHVAGGNLGIPRMAGVQRAPSMTLGRDAEKTMTDKAQVVAALRASFAHVKQAVMDVPDDQMDTAVDLFGQPSTRRGVLVLLATHNHEHLGQAIAYARSIGVVPPWSRGGDGGE